MAKIEIELTDEQLKKVETLKEHDIDVGQAIDMLFEVKDKALSEINTIDDEEIGIFEKVKGNALDVDTKADILEENFGDSDKSYEMKVQDVKHKIRWARDFFRF